MYNCRICGKSFEKLSDCIKCEVACNEAQLAKEKAKELEEKNAKEKQELDKIQKEYEHLISDIDHHFSEYQKPVKLDGKYVLVDVSGNAYSSYLLRPFFDGTFGFGF